MTSGSSSVLPTIDRIAHSSLDTSTSLFFSRRSVLRFSRRWTSRQMASARRKSRNGYSMPCPLTWTALWKLKSISVKYFNEAEQGRKCDVQDSDGNTVILDRWCLRSSRPLVHEKTTLIYFNKDAISANTEQESILKTIDGDAAFKASSASAFFRSVEINDLWDGTAFASPNGGRFSGRRRTSHDHAGIRLLELRLRNVQPRQAIRTADVQRLPIVSRTD